MDVRASVQVSLRAKRSQLYYLNTRAGRGLSGLAMTALQTISNRALVVLDTLFLDKIDKIAKKKEGKEG